MKNGPYELVVAPKSYPGKKYRERYIYEHHLVWWENTGSIVPKGYVIHHKNSEKRDNRFENLELYEGKEHNRRHGLDQGKSFIKLVCTKCGIEFMRETRQVKPKLKSGQQNFFCCRSHQVSYQQTQRYRNGV